MICGSPPPICCRPAVTRRRSRRSPPSSAPKVFYSNRAITAASGRVESDNPAALTPPQLQFLAEPEGTHYPATGFPIGGLDGNTTAWTATEIADSSSTRFQRYHRKRHPRSFEAPPKSTPRRPFDNWRIRAMHLPTRKSGAGRRNTTVPTGPASSRRPRMARRDPLPSFTRRRIRSARRPPCAHRTRKHRDPQAVWNLDGYSRPQGRRGPGGSPLYVGDTASAPALAPKGTTVPAGGPYGGRQARRHFGRDARDGIPLRVEARLPCLSLGSGPINSLSDFTHTIPKLRLRYLWGVWFGDLRPLPVPKPPDGFELPKSAPELEQMLWDRAPPDERNRLAVIAIDVSGLPA